MKNVLRFCRRAIISFLPSRWATVLLFVCHQKRIPKLRSPTTFSELLLHRKLGPVDPRFVMLSDKLAVKSHVASVLGDDWVIPTLWSGSELEAVPDIQIPHVIKSAGGSGYNIFIIDPTEAKSVLKDKVSMLRAGRYPKYYFERWYDRIPEKYLIEPILLEEDGPLKDYKFFCFGGKVEFIQVDTNRFTNHRRSLFDRDWNWLPLSLKYSRHEVPPPAPMELNELIRAAELLSRGYEFVRVDLYDTSRGPKFGEMTFCPGSGIERFFPSYYDAIFGASWIRNRNH